MVYLQPVRRPYSSFYKPEVGLTASLEHYLEDSPEGTLGGISYAFPLYFIVLFLHISSIFYGFIKVNYRGYI